MSMSPVRVLFVTLVVLAFITNTTATCNLLAVKFRLLGCTLNNRFPCGLIDGKMRLLGCKRFACDGYRNLDTYCTPFCRDLEISNGICRFGTKCCLSNFGSSSSFSLERSWDSDEFELTFIDEGVAELEAN